MAVTMQYDSNGGEVYVACIGINKQYVRVSFSVSKYGRKIAQEAAKSCQRRLDNYIDLSEKTKKDFKKFKTLVRNASVSMANRRSTMKYDKPFKITKEEIEMYKQSYFDKGGEITVLPDDARNSPMLGHSLFLFAITHKN